MLGCQTNCPHVFVIFCYRLLRFGFLRACRKRLNAWQDLASLVSPVAATAFQEKVLLSRLLIAWRIFFSSFKTRAYSSSLTVSLLYLVFIQNVELLLSTSGYEALVWLLSTGEEGIKCLLQQSMWRLFQKMSLAIIIYLFHGCQLLFGPFSCFFFF